MLLGSFFFLRYRDARRWKHLVGSLVKGGQNLPLMLEVELTVLPNIGGPLSPLAHPAHNCFPSPHCCTVNFASVLKIEASKKFLKGSHLFWSVFIEIMNNWNGHGTVMTSIRGHLISEWIYAVIVSPKNTNKKLSRFRLYFGRNDDFINSFWNCLTFNNRTKSIYVIWMPELLIPQPSSP